MTLEKAIEIQTQHQKGTDPLYLPDLPIAEKLLIDAAKRVDHCRRWTSSTWGSPLPGETQ